MTPVYNLIKHCLIGAYISFLGMAAICALLYPRIFEHYNYGISYFGTVRTTMIVYYLGLAGAITCLGIIAHQLGRFGREARPLRLAFWATAILLTGVAATSYSISHTVFVWHVVFDIALTLNQLAITAWILAQKHSKSLDYWLAVILVVTVVISVLPLIHHLLVIRSFPLREVIVYVCALALMGRAALRIARAH